MSRMKKRSLAMWTALGVIFLFNFAIANHDYHVVFSTECNDYFDWQSATLVASANHVGLEAPITRLMACDDPNPSGLDIVENTFVHKNWARNPNTGDVYGPYNKPKSLSIWLEEAPPKETYILVLDTDMVFSNNFRFELFNVRRGRAASAQHNYLVGLSKGVHMDIKSMLKHPNKAEKVGGYILMHKDDLREVAPLWHKYSEIIRSNPGNWPEENPSKGRNMSKDPPWIAEMYGYSFACAEVGVSHEVPPRAMIYPGYVAEFDPWPVLIHYALTIGLEDYAFDKHWYHRYQMLKCPGKLFPEPPRLEDLILYPHLDKYAQRREELTHYTLQMIYNATKDRIEKKCSGLMQVERMPRQYYKCEALNRPGSCQPASKEDAQAHLRSLPEFRGICMDLNSNCKGWAARGECENNPGYMYYHCRESCNLCPKSSRKGGAKASKRGTFWDMKLGRKAGPRDDEKTKSKGQDFESIPFDASRKQASMSSHQGGNAAASRNLEIGSFKHIRPYHLFGVLGLTIVSALVFIYWKLSGRIRSTKSSFTRSLSRSRR